MRRGRNHERGKERMSANDKKESKQDTLEREVESVVDEETAGLDPAEAGRIREKVRARVLGDHVVVVAHLQAELGVQLVVPLLEPGQQFQQASEQGLQALAGPAFSSCFLGRSASGINFS